MNNNGPMIAKENELGQYSDGRHYGNGAWKSTRKEKKLTLMQKVKKEAQHYWDGTKLLVAEIKISTRLAVKMAAGLRAVEALP